MINSPVPIMTPSQIQEEVDGLRRAGAKVAKTPESARAFLRKIGLNEHSAGKSHAAKSKAASRVRTKRTKA